MLAETGRGALEGLALLLPVVESLSTNIGSDVLRPQTLHSQLLVT